MLSCLSQELAELKMGWAGRVTWVPTLLSPEGSRSDLALVLKTFQEGKEARYAGELQAHTEIGLHA